jgi:tRNA(fMet)-specific endonuclease VapC
MAGVILETSFLVDYERELARGRPSNAHRFLEADESRQLCITPTVAGELAAGESLRDRQTWDEFLAGFQMLTLGPDVCWEYGSAHRYLKRNGLLIGANDLWIAAAGLAYGMPVVTRIRRDFERVPGLEVLSHA